MMYDVNQMLGFFFFVLLFMVHFFTVEQDLEWNHYSSFDTIFDIG